MPNDQTNAPAPTTGGSADTEANPLHLVFNQDGTFEAVWAAEAWCRENGVSCGANERGKPRGLLYGDFLISKWHNMSRAEIAALDGRMSGDMRNGPVTIDIRSRPPITPGPL